jgi:hypothetical protein
LADTEPEAQDTEVTKLEDIVATRIDGVLNPANGAPFLLIKAITASGALNEKPDIAGAEKILQLLAQLIQSEASELAAGRWDETCDISLLTEAAGLVKLFRRGEQMAAETEAAMKALSEAIPAFAMTIDKDNPLADKADDKTSTDAVKPVDKAAETQPTENHETPVADLVKSAVAEAMKTQEAANAELRDEIAKLRDKPIPGGPYFTAPNRKPAEDKISKAAAFERQAEIPDLDRDLVAYYQSEARRLRAEAEAA